ncbi:MAG TPA: DUF4331 domain-containing protein [Actinomycetota bacterium]|jgi:hypothetical protein|nr:DUF4331 domain-containing protein [Actinomycetota bacterium]
MSSHREAPGTAQDPVADNTDLYAFVSPDKPSTVTLIANFIPTEYPPGGPNFYEFGDDVLYQIHIDNRGDSGDDLKFQFRFSTQVTAETFLYNTGPISSLTDPNWVRRQTYSVTMVRNGTPHLLGNGLACPPVNIGPRSTPDYGALADAARHDLGNGVKVFAGQRDEAFFVDLGSIFDLGDLRPFQNLHLIPTPAAEGINGLGGFNVHSIAIQLPKTMLTRDGSNPTDASKASSVIGVWASASRRRSTIRDAGGKVEGSGPWVQVSRLGNPLVNEVLIPMDEKDLWNSVQPADDAQFAKYYAHPELATLLPILYPGVFPHLKGLSAARADLEAILLTGIPSGIVPGFQNFTGAAPADMLRLNMAIPPTSKPNRLGVVGGDLAGFPNGRRLPDDVTTIELRAIAGLTYPLVAPSYTPDGAASAIQDGSVSGQDVDTPYPGTFPYMGTPHAGYSTDPPHRS